MQEKTTRNSSRKLKSEGEENGLSIESLGAWAGSAMAIIALLAYFIKPVVASFSKITDTLNKVNHNLDLLNKDLEASKSDRQSLHDELKNHDERLDRHSEKLVSHDEQLKTLFKERK
jgi:septal ring factor EnvC (AmiA/AmiB activator)